MNVNQGYRVLPTQYYVAPAPQQVAAHGYGADVDERVSPWGPPNVSQPPPPLPAAQAGPPECHQGCRAEIERLKRLLEEKHAQAWPPLPSAQHSSFAAHSARRNHSASTHGRRSWPSRERSPPTPLERPRSKQTTPPQKLLSLELQQPSHLGRAQRSPGRNKRFQRRNWPINSRYGDREKEYRMRSRLLARLHREKRPPADSKCTISERKGNILTSPELYKAVPIAADFQPFRGLAKQVLDVCGKPTDSTEVHIGDAVPVKVDEKLTWLLLVTAQRSWHRAQYNFDKFLQNFETAITNFASFIIKNKIKEVAIPYLCSGRGRLNWLFVKDLLITKLQDCEVNISVYHMEKDTLPENLQASAAASPSTSTGSPAIEIENGTEGIQPLSPLVSNQDPQSPRDSIPIIEDSSLIEAEQPCEDAPSAARDAPLPPSGSPTTESENREEEIPTLSTPVSSQAFQSTGNRTSAAETTQHEKTTTVRRRLDNGPCDPRITRARSAPSFCKAHHMRSCDRCTCVPPPLLSPPTQSAGNNNNDANIQPF